jgi:hypothetical protein
MRSRAVSPGLESIVCLSIRLSVFLFFPAQWYDLRLMTLVRTPPARNRLDVNAETSTLPDANLRYQEALD